MTCFQVNVMIAKQLAAWVYAIVSWWEQQCSQITEQIQQWQQQWQNQCSNVTSKVCKALPWPFDSICGWVTKLVCTLVSVLVLVVVLIVETICLLVQLFLTIALLVTWVVLVAVVMLVCLLIPCRTRMESSVPPDDGWMVTLGQATPSRLSQENEVVFLPDAREDASLLEAALKNLAAHKDLPPAEPHPFPGGSQPCTSGRTGRSSLNKP